MSEDNRNSIGNPDAIASTIGKHFDICILVILYFDNLRKFSNFDSVHIILSYLFYSVMVEKC